MSGRPVGDESVPATANTSRLLDKIRLVDNPPTPTISNAIIGVVRYEAIRSLTLMRVLVWLALIGFPVTLASAALLILEAQFPEKGETLVTLSFFMFVLLPQAVTVLSMLLFAAPIVNSELENQSWVYAVVRPKARRAILLGKYIVAVLWCGSCTSIGAVLIVLVAKYFRVPLAETVIGIQLALCWLAAICYGALFVAIGTFFQRRAMVYAFAYSIGVEALMGWIPAVVNLFTISYRLRSLLLSWASTQVSLDIEKLPFQWEDTPIKHLAILLIIAVGLLTISVWRIDRSQYRWQSEV